jgi:hypothetical protein
MHSSILLLFNRTATNYYDDEIDTLIAQLSVNKSKQKVVRTKKPNAQRHFVTGVYKYVHQPIRKCQKCGSRVDDCECHRTRQKTHRDNRRTWPRVDHTLYSESAIGHNQNVEEYGITSGPSVLSTNAGTAGVDMSNRPVTSVGQTTGYTGIHSLSDATIRETTWDLRRIMERPNLVTTFEWTQSSPQFMETLAVPHDLITTVLSKVPFSAFQYWRGDIILRIQVAGAPLIQGLLAASFIPLSEAAQVRTFEINIPALTLNPTVYLYANTNTSAELRIPFKHIQSYLSTGFPNDISGQLGIVKIYWLNKLASVSGEPVTVSIFSIFENSEFKVPVLSSLINPRAAVIDRSLQSESVYYDTTLVSESGIIGSMLGAASSLLSGTGTMNMVPSDIMSVATSAMKRVKGVTHRQGMKEVVNDATANAMPTNFLGDVLDMAGAMFGLDNPTVPVPDPSVVIRGNGPLNYSEGPEHIEKLSVYPSAMNMVTEETFATVTDEMDMDYLKRRYTYVGTFQQTTEPPATVLYSIPMSPMLIAKNTIGNVAQVQDPVPFLSYLGIPFRYWTGSLTYKLQVIGTMMHTTKIYVAFNYGVFNSPTTLLDATSQYGVVYEVTQGSNEFEFRVPYVATTPYKQVYNGTYDERNTMGYINIVVLNTLIAPVSVQPYIDYNIFMAAGPDFTYEILSSSNDSLVPIYRQAPALKTHIPNLSLNTLVYTNDAKGRNYRHDHEDVQTKDKHDRAQGFEMITRDKTLKSEGEHDDTLVSESSDLSEATAPTNIALTTTDTVVDVQTTAPPERDLTVDAHFGIMTRSVRDLLKKYQYCESYRLRQFSVSTAPDINTAVLSMAHIVPSKFFALPIERVIGAVYAPTRRGSGLFAWASGMFRQWRGPLRFKVVINGANRNQVARVYWHPFYNDNQYTLDQENTLVALCSPELSLSTGPPYSISSDQHLGGMTLTPVVSAMATAPLTVVEFEVPFTTRYLSLLTGAGYAGDSNYYTEKCNPGSIILTVFPPQREHQSITADVYMAIGDETRLGTLYNVPALLNTGVYNIPTERYTGPMFPTTYSV